eukprot:4126825-Pyramimonas_sp.AAC.1
MNCWGRGHLIGHNDDNDCCATTGHLVRYQQHPNHFWQTAHQRLVGRTDASHGAVSLKALDEPPGVQLLRAL